MGRKKKQDMVQPHSWFKFTSAEETLEQIARLFFEEGLDQGEILDEFIRKGIVDEANGRREVRDKLRQPETDDSADTPEPTDAEVHEAFRKLYCRRIRDVTAKIRESGRLKYLAPEEQERANEIRLRQQDRGLQEVRVVNTNDPQHVAAAAAQHLCRWMLSQSLQRKEEIHIGFTGGRTPRLMSRRLAQVIARPDAFDVGRREDFPRRIVFHSLVGDLNDEDPLSDPFASFLYLSPGSPDNTSEDDLTFGPIDVSFRSFPAPGVVTSEERAHLAKFSLIRRVTENLPPLDVIVCSCGHWGPGCRSAFDHLERACRGQKDLESQWKRTQNKLDALGVIGDFAWMPITRRGPVSIGQLHNLPLWVTTLVPSYMPKYLEDAEASANEQSPPRVLLLAGPCSGETCQDSKGRLMHGILDAPFCPVTDLITDITSAREFLTPQRPPG